MTTGLMLADDRHQQSVKWDCSCGVETAYSTDEMRIGRCFQCPACKARWRSCGCREFVKLD